MRGYRGWESHFQYNCVTQLHDVPTDTKLNYVTSLLEELASDLCSACSPLAWKLLSGVLTLFVRHHCRMTTILLVKYRLTALVHLC